MLNEGRGGDHLRILGQTRLLVDVDYFEFASVFKVIFAKLPGVFYRFQGFGRHSSDKKTQDEFL